MSKYIVEFVRKESIEVEANGVGAAYEYAFTLVNHNDYRKSNNLKDLGFKILGIREVGVEGMDYGPRRVE